MTDYNPPFSLSDGVVGHADAVGHGALLLWHAVAREHAAAGSLRGAHVVAVAGGQHHD